MREKLQNLSARDLLRVAIFAGLIALTAPALVDSVRVGSNPTDSYPGIALAPTFLQKLNLGVEGIRINAWGVYELSSVACTDTANPINGKPLKGNGRVRLETPIL